MPATGPNVPGEQVVTASCSSHCGSRCLLKVHVKDGIIRRIETDDGEEPQYRACLRGRAYRQRVYDPQRLRYPMRRTGERGEGRFERISWAEAIDTIAEQLQRVKAAYGPQSILFVRGGGDTTMLHHADLIERVFALFGGYQRWWGNVSCEAGLFASYATYGTLNTGNTRDDLVDSRLIVMWGWDPAVTIHECNTPWYLSQAREAGARIIAVDPRYTESAATFAHQWIPLRPGTDTAMLVAMAHVIIDEGLQNQKFLDTYTIGFERFRAYVMGSEDGIPKSPHWASPITGVPADTIRLLAREYAVTRPAALVAGIGPGRSARGEQYHRAAHVLSAMTGNIGIRGGWAGDRSWQPQLVGGYPFKVGKRLTAPENPIERGSSRRRNALPEQGGAGSAARIHCSKVADAILKGKSGGYPADYKLAYVTNTNFVNQYPNTNKAIEAFKRLEFIAVQEQLMTPMARLADILLPTCTMREKNDINTGGATPFYGYVNKVIEPLYESKSQLDIANALASRLGITGYNEKTEDELLHDFVQGSDVPDYLRFKREGFYRIKLAEPYIAFKAQIEDPQNNPFPTPSGKIEIYCQRLADMNDPEIPPVPMYLDNWESFTDPLAKKYPLQLVTTHFKRRAHTQFDTLPWLREVQTQAIQISGADAAARGIADGDMVRVFNDRGEIVLPAWVSQRIMPGVVDLPQGAWYNPDRNGIDRGGCANVLSRDEHSPGGASCTNTCLVQIAKA